LRTYGNDAITLDAPTLFGCQKNARGNQTVDSNGRTRAKRKSPFFSPRKNAFWKERELFFNPVFCIDSLGTSVLHDLTSEMDLGLILKNSLIVCGVGLRSNTGG
jgi:hypothetical protein